MNGGLGYRRQSYMCVGDSGTGPYRRRRFYFQQTLGRISRLALQSFPPQSHPPSPSHIIDNLAAATSIISPANICATARVTTLLHRICKASSPCAINRPDTISTSLSPTFGRQPDLVGVRFRHGQDKPAAADPTDRAGGVPPWAVDGTRLSWSATGYRSECGASAVEGAIDAKAVKADEDTPDHNQVGW